MYSWIWRKLPGSFYIKLAEVTFLILAVTALLLFVVFPWVEPRLPFNNVTVNQ